MELQRLDLNDDLVELIHNPNLAYRSYLLRFTNYCNEKYEMRTSREDMVRLADFIYKYLENK